MGLQISPTNSARNSSVRYDKLILASDFIQASYVLIGIATAAGCCVTPILLGFKFDFGRHESYNAPIIFSVKSEDFKISLVGCFSISIPIALEFILDIYLLSSKSNIRNGFFERGLLIFVLVLSNVITLNYVIPFEDSATLFTILNIHLIAIIVCAFSYLYKFGSPVFNRKMAIISGSFSCCGIICQQFLLFTGYRTSIVIISFQIIAFIVGYMSFFYLAFQWFFQLRNINRNEMTLNQYGCSVYVISLIIVFIGFLILRIINPYDFQDISPAALCGISYIEGSFTFLIAILPGRMARQESVQAKVS